MRGSGRARRGPPAWHRVADPGHGRIDQCSRAGQHQGKQGPETRISPALEQILLDPLQAPHPNTCRHQQPEQNPLEIPAMRIPRRGRPRSWHGRQFRRRFPQGNRRGRGGVFLRHGKFPLNVRRPGRAGNDSGRGFRPDRTGPRQKAKPTSAACPVDVSPCASRNPAAVSQTLSRQAARGRETSERFRDENGQRRSVAFQAKTGCRRPPARRSPPARIR